MRVGESKLIQVGNLTKLLADLPSTCFVSAKTRANTGNLPVLVPKNKNGETEFVQMGYLDLGEEKYTPFYKEGAENNGDT